MIALVQIKNAAAIFTTVVTLSFAQVSMAQVTIEVVEGDEQAVAFPGSGLILTPAEPLRERLDTAPKVRVRANGAPAPNVLVEFSAPLFGGLGFQFSSNGQTIASVTTDAAGIATAPLPITPAGAFVQNSVRGAPFSLLANISARALGSDSSSVQFVQSIYAYREICPPISPGKTEIFAKIMSTQPLIVRVEKTVGSSTIRSALTSADGLHFLINRQLVYFAITDIPGQYLIRDEASNATRTLVVRTTQRTCTETGAISPPIAFGGLNSTPPSTVNTLSPTGLFLLFALLSWLVKRIS